VLRAREGFECQQQGETGVRNDTQSVTSPQREKKTTKGGGTQERTEGAKNKVPQKPPTPIQGSTAPAAPKSRQQKAKIRRKKKTLDEGWGDNWDKGDNSGESWQASVKVDKRKKNVKNTKQQGQNCTHSREAVFTDHETQGKRAKG